ncbi:Uncharacterised protein [uncultured archaeon]|nr:Uncharacterised protein [uncultured archaeon]
MPARKTQEEFIHEAQEIHKNDPYDYSLVNYTNNHTKVTIVCEKHGSFQQIPSDHLRGIGCPKCGIERRTQKNRGNTENFIAKARKVHGNFYDYSKVNYVTAFTPVCIICPTHGEFWQKPSCHLNGNHCKQYGSELLSLSLRSNTKDFITKARKVHGNFYDYSKVEYVNNHTSVIIICPRHGQFLQTPNAHLEGQHCPKCAHEIRVQKKLSNTIEFIDRAKKIHAQKNYDYSKVTYIHNKKKVCIICPIHGKFWQTPNEHLNGCGCNKCAIEFRAQETTSNTNDFIGKAQEIHKNDSYDYSKVRYTNAFTKICIICPIHGKFWQIPNTHLNGAGCPICGGTAKLTTENFITKAEKVHGNDYDYSKVEYVNTDTKVCIICSKHGEFWQAPTTHLSGAGCSLCHESRGERRIRLLLKRKKIKFERQVHFAECRNIFPLRFDFGIYQGKKLLGLIEYQGIQHYGIYEDYGGVKGYELGRKRDAIKVSYCSENHIPLLVIPYYESNNLEEILDRFTNSIIHN